MSQEEILAIDQYCQIHQISRRQRLHELHLTEGMYYSSKRRLLRRGIFSTPSSFVKLSPPLHSLSPNSESKDSSLLLGNSPRVSSSEAISMEVIYPSGISLRIHNSISNVHLQLLLSALSGHVSFRS